MCVCVLLTCFTVLLCKPKESVGALFEGGWDVCVCVREGGREGGGGGRVFRVGGHLKVTGRASGMKEDVCGGLVRVCECLYACWVWAWVGVCVGWCVCLWVCVCVCVGCIV